MAAVCGYIGRTDKSPGLPWALPAARGRRRAADLVQLPAPLRGPQRRPCSCEAPGVRGRAGFTRSRAHAEQGSRSPGSQGWLNSPAASARCGRWPRRGFHRPPAPADARPGRRSGGDPRPRTPTPRAPRELLSPGVPTLNQIDENPCPCGAGKKQDKSIKSIDSVHWQWLMIVSCKQYPSF